MRPIFSEMDYRLSVVKRWGVVLTIQKQSVAEHAFNSSRIAERIAREWFGITDQAMLYQIVRRALYHDDFEAVMGDPPSYMKKYIDEPRLVDDVSDLFPHLNVHVDLDFMRVICKVADYIEACVFLRMEISLGNQSVTGHLRALEARFKKYLSENPVKSIKVESMYELYITQVVDPMFGSSGQFKSEGHGGLFK